MKKKQAVSLAGWVSVVTNTFLFVIKFWAGTVTGSVAIIADAWHTLSDSISSIAVIVGARVAAKPADSKHPFGHGRAETIAAIFIGVLLAVIGFEFLTQAYHQWRDKSDVEYGSIAIIVTVAAIVVKELLAQFSFYMGRKYNSTPLKADGWHHRSDSISSVLILIGIFLSDYIPHVDSILGAIVAFMILWTSRKIIHDEVNLLMGISPDKKVIKQIRTLAAETTRMEVFLHHFHSHVYGEHTEMTCHMKLPGNISLYRVHKISTAIEKVVDEKLSIELTIHAEPMDDHDWDLL